MTSPFFVAGQAGKAGFIVAQELGASDDESLFVGVCCAGLVALLLMPR